MSDKIYLDYDQAELDRQYNQSAWAPDMDQTIARYATLSAHARDRHPPQRNVRYDPADGALLDIFPAKAPGAPVMVFIHGGAWQRLSKEDSAFLADAMVEAGAAYVAVNFGNIPAVTLDEMVRQNREAIAWVWRNAASFNADPARLFVCGHSSGGHLTGMMATTDWRATNGLPHSPLAGAICLSGSYDLEPVVLSYRGDYLKLDAQGVVRNSPIKHVGHIASPLIVGYADGETDEFRRQGDAFVAAVRDAGKECEFITLTGKNHFDMVLTVNEPDSPLGSAVRRFMGL